MERTGRRATGLVIISLGIKTNRFTFYLAIRVSHAGLQDISDTIFTM
jgi:hypothetical protein